MSLDHEKIMNRLLVLRKKLKSNVDRKLKQTTKKYNIDLTKVALVHAGSLIKEEIDEIFEDETEKFKYIRILVDYSSCDSEINTIVDVVNSTKDEIASELSTGSKIDDFKFLINESIKTIILEFPSSWGTIIVDDYRKSFLETLRNKDIVKF